ncbi:MAG: ALTO [Arowana adomavirus]|uniref:ALTO n=1 Tax=Arowana adomavirus TaxID=2219223 RepID=A0A2U9Q1V4_9VIRU|nr:MAG: ALTO [Arowana adomavirus]
MHLMKQRKKFWKNLTKPPLRETIRLIFRRQGQHHRKRLPHRPKGKQTQGTVSLLILMFPPGNRGNGGRRGKMSLCNLILTLILTLSLSVRKILFRHLLHKHLRDLQNVIHILCLEISHQEVKRDSKKTLRRRLVFSRMKRIPAQKKAESLPTVSFLLRILRLHLTGDFSVTAAHHVATLAVKVSGEMSDNKNRNLLHKGQGLQKFRVCLMSF